MTKDEIELNIGDSITRLIWGCSAKVTFTKTLAGWRLDDGRIVPSIEEEIIRINHEHYGDE